MRSAIRASNRSENMEKANKENFPTPKPAAGPAARGSRRLRVLIADDHVLVRAGICELVKLLPNVEIVAQAGDGREALRLIKRHNPDIVLMDIAMPEMNGLEATVLAKKQFPSVRVILLSERSSEEFVLRALRSGAEGFVLKDDPVDELYSAIKAVAQGGEHLSSQVTRRVVQGYLGRQPGAEASVKLTTRQREVLQLIADGKATKEIASLLKISINTVKTHRLKLMEKLGAHEITGVVRYAAKLGLLKSQILSPLVPPLLLTYFS